MRYTYETLTASRARQYVDSPEDIIQVVCRDCKKGNLDLIEPDFCEIQTAYGVDGEHPAIQAAVGVLLTPQLIRCTKFVGEQ